MSSGLRVLEVDPELGRDLDGDAPAEAIKTIVLPALRLRARPWEMARPSDQATKNPGSRGARSDDIPAYR